MDLIIIGAGPYGLSLAAYAESKGLDCIVIGKPLEFWQDNMPEGMILRSNINWDIDPIEQYTLEKYLGNDLGPEYELSRETFLNYCIWFLANKKLSISETYVNSIVLLGNGNYQVATNDQSNFISKNIVIATGSKLFNYIPERLASLIPIFFYSHTCFDVDLKKYNDQKVLIVGGRQSAFECAALLLEANCEKTYMSFPHDMPSFVNSNWEWADVLVNKFRSEPDWYINLEQGEKDKIQKSFWGEGRLKIEPWLKAHIKNENLVIFENSIIENCENLNNESILVKLDTGDLISIDHVIFATGFRIEINRIPFLQNSNFLGDLKISDGFPVLKSDFQSNLKGLYFAGNMATNSMGPFFGFLLGAKVSAELIIESVIRNIDLVRS